MSAEPLWFKDAVFYQLRVASYRDSDGDGIGDLRGLTERLDYLRDLGVTALWLLPFYPSPLRDDGYDIADYASIHPRYGTMRDFRAFLREAHRRDLRVVTELVLNHTSDQHPWFQRARRAPAGSRWRNFYVWSDTPQRYADARIIFKDFETSNWAWDPVAGAYYWHRFYSHQPDLNFDNPEVRRALLQVVDQWFEMGVDGLRLDAVPYLVEREGTSCENLPETHAFLQELRRHVDEKFEDRMLLAEANQWPEDAAAYFGKGEECHMAFHFPIMPRLYMAVHMEDRYPIIDILEQTPSIPETCQWALFLRNHDELTLEMVTDEERDYLWRVYARDPQARINLGIRRRLAPLLGNNRRRIELMNALLFSMPGTPVVYYGDEIGMGDNVYLGDRNGVRTPMQWTPDRNAGFSDANPQRLLLPVIVDPEYHFEALNVETQERNPSSLLWWMKRILALRHRYRAFGRGTIEFLTPANRRILAFLRRHESECVLVVVNLSRFSQYVELDLEEFAGRIPVELFGGIEFPAVEGSRYLLTLGPHAFYWFSLEPPRIEPEDAAEAGAPPEIEVEASWRALLAEAGRRQLERALPRYLRTRRWFRGKARSVEGVRVVDAVALGAELEGARLAFAEVRYREGDPELYVLPLALAPPGGAHEVVAELRRGRGEPTHLVDASADPRLPALLLDLLARRRRLRGEHLEIRGVPGRELRRLRGPADQPLPASLLGAEQSNTSWIHGDRLVAKLYRCIAPGESVELEMVRHLTERTDFASAPALAGHLELRLGRDEVATLAIFQAFVPSQGDAWSYTLDEIARSFEVVRSVAPGGEDVPTAPAALETAPRAEADVTANPFGVYLEMAELLGRRTAQMHLALAADADDPAFAPEPFTPFARRSLYQSQRNLCRRVLATLSGRIDAVPESERDAALAVLAREAQILERFRELVEAGDAGRRIRCHGDYHLGQVLHTGRDFAIIDFEGEPARAPGERRAKRSPLVDVAGMLRSFHYAVETVRAGRAEGSRLRPEDVEALRDWSVRWNAAVAMRFLDAYLGEIGPARLVPERPEDLRRALDVFLLEKSLYELGYELNNRPDWVSIPLRGVLAILEGNERAGPEG